MSSRKSLRGFWTLAYAGFFSLTICGASAMADEPAQRAASPVLTQANPADPAPPANAPATAPAAAQNPAAPNAGRNARKASVKSLRKVAWLELDGPLPDGPPPFRIIPTDEGPKSLRRIVNRLAELGRDRSVTGAVIYLNQPELGMAQVDELSRAIISFRAMGKRVIVFAEGYDLQGYLLAVNANRITLIKNGEIGITGLSMEEMYLAGLLEKVGAKADFIQIGKFKGADEQLTRTGPSPEWSSTIDAVLDGMYGEFINAIATSRKKKTEEVEKFFGESWKLTSDELLKAGWIDAVVDRGMVDETENVFGTDFEFVQLLERKTNAQAPENPFAMMQMIMQPQQRTLARNSIAVISAQGAIMSGRSNARGRTGLFSESSIGSQTLQEALADAKDEPMIVGVVIRINSPGGSALASEVIWQAVREVQDSKPVYISIGGMAASGGYYIACAGEKIYVLPNSIVGSIGVVAGKVTLGGLYEKLGVAIHRRNRGPMADIFNSVTAFTPEQADLLKVAMQRTYQIFLDRVKTGRGQKIANVDDVAQGRLFTGKQAVANGMADKVGGLSTAVDDMVKDLKLVPGSFDVIEWPPPMNLAEFIDNYLQSLAAGDMPQDQAALAAPVALVKQMMGQRTWASVAPVATGMMLLSREHVLTLMPVALVFK